MGCTIRYEYGLFRQKIMDGNQVELPDNWLENGNVLGKSHARSDTLRGALRRPRVKKTDRWATARSTSHVDYTTVLAVPYDMPVRGLRYRQRSYRCACGRRARPSASTWSTFNKGDYVQRHGGAQILPRSSPRSSIPRTTTTRASELRLKQHYFFTSATMQYAVNDFIKALWQPI